MMMIFQGPGAMIFAILFGAMDVCLMFLMGLWWCNPRVVKEEDGDRGWMNR